MSTSFSTNCRVAAAVAAAGMLRLPAPIQSEVFGLLAAVMAAFLLLCTVVKATRRWVPGLAIIPCVFACASAQLYLPATLLPPPEFLRFVQADGSSAKAPGRAVYVRALDAEARVIRVSRGAVVAELALKEVRVRSARFRAPRKRPVRHFGRWRPLPEKRGSGRYRRRDRMAAFSRRPPARSTRASSALGPESGRSRRSRVSGGPSRAGAVPFAERFTLVAEHLAHVSPVRIALRVPGLALRTGCTVSLRLYGRALPRRVEPRVSEKLRAERLWFSVYASRRFHVRSLNCPPLTLRERLLARVRRTLSGGHFVGEHGDALRGMLLGNAQELTYSTRRELGALGVRHLFAASGLHMMLLFGAAYAFFSLCFGRNNWFSLLPALALCFAYLWLLDFPVSLSRAFLFCVLFSLAKVAGRATMSVDVFWVTVLLLLAWMPHALFSLSGLLSCSAVGAIFYSAGRLTRCFVRMGLGRLSASFSVGVAALCGTTPITTLVFGGHSFLAVFANAILVPAAGLVLPAGLAFSAVALVPGLEGLALALAWPVSWLARAFVAGAQALAPYSLYAKSGMWDVVPCLGALCVFCGVFKMRSDEPPVRRRLLLVAVGIALLGPGGALVVDGVRLALLCFS